MYYTYAELFMLQNTSYQKWVKFGVGSLLAPRGFSPGTPVSPSPQKPPFLNSSSIRHPRAIGLSVARLLDVTLVKKSLFILFIYLFIFRKGVLLVP